MTGAPEITSRSCVLGMDLDFGDISTKYEFPQYEYEILWPSVICSVMRYDIGLQGCFPKKMTADFRRQNCFVKNLTSC